MKRVIIAALAIVAVVGCDKEQAAQGGDTKAAVAFVDGEITRAAGTEWGSDDVVGISVLTAGEVAESGYTPNAQYSVDISQSAMNCTFKPVTETDKHYFSIYESDLIDFVAYYPYAAEVAEQGMAYSVDVAEQESPELIDFMVASTYDGTAESGYNKTTGKDGVALEFHRQLAKISITLVDGAAVDVDEVTSVKIVGLPLTAQYELVAAQFSNLGAAADTSVELLAEGDDLYSAIIIPTEDSEGDAVYTVGDDVAVVITTAATGPSDADEIYVCPIAGADFTAGYNHPYTITVEKTPVLVEGNKITDWTTVADNTVIEPK